MYSAADLIDAVQRKLRVTARRNHPVGEFPPGWQEWLAAMRGHAGAVTGATADAIVAVFLQRPLASAPRRLASMSRWQAFSSVWRQQWHGLASDHERRDERGLRWLAGATTAVVHLFLGVFMLWLLFAPVRIASPPPQGETVVQVEYIGDGTPEEIGGDPAPQTQDPVEEQVADAPAEATDPAPLGPSPLEPALLEPPPAPRLAELTAPATVPELDMPLPQIVPRDVPTPPTPVPPVEQPLTVTESTPDTPDAFVLPPTTARIAEPALSTPELTAIIPSVRQVTVPEPFQPPASTPRVVQPEVAAPVLSQRIPEVVQREITAPLPRPIVRELTPAPVAAPALRPTVPQVRRATLPTPTAAPAPSSAATPASAAATTPASSTSAPAPTATAPGSGPRPAPAPGSWATPSRADDWGDAARDQPGAQRGERPGLYDSDGSVRLAETPGSASPAQPPGTITDEITDLDRSGTWLKRKPTDYEPTAFDQFWRPNETLLEEWVRRSVTTVRIPIPGTSKHVVCHTVMLALGGGCGISDPNLNEQPATARPPPDIPFKPHLQEDNGSVPPAGGLIGSGRGLNASSGSSKPRQSSEA